MYLVKVQNIRKKNDTGLKVQKPYLGIIYTEANIEEDIDMKNQFRIIILLCPVVNTDAAFKSIVDNKMENDIYFKDNKLENIKFVNVNYQPAIDSHLTPKVYVDNAIDELSIVRNILDKNFNKYNLTSISSILQS